MSAQHSKAMTQNPFDGTNIYGSWPGFAALGGIAGFAAGSAMNIFMTYHGFPMSWTSSLEFAIRHALQPVEYGPAIGGAVLLAAKPLWEWLNGTNNASPDRHVRGNALVSPQTLAKRTRHNDGLPLSPSLRLGMGDETTHILIVGGSGGGKTTVLWPFLIEGRQRGDRQMIFSYKGDFQERWPTTGFTLLAPWDSRSAVWVMGEDFRNRLDAGALAATLIPEPKGNSDPIWTKGSREILKSIIIKLQTELPGQWTAGQFAAMLMQCLADFDVLQATVAKYNPLANSHIAGGADSKTTISFLNEISAAGADLQYLAPAEAGNTNAERWSARRWVLGRAKHKTVILGFLPSAKDFASKFVASIIEATVLRVLDLPDKEPDERRIWLVVDEAPQAGQVPTLTTALEAGRSKGLRLVLGIQSTAQMHKTYDEHTKSIWAGQTAIKIITRIKDEADQKWASSLTGDAEIDRMQTSTSTSVGKPSGTSTTKNYQRVREPVLLPKQIENDLFAKAPKRGEKLDDRRHFVRALVMSEYGDAILDFKFRRPPKRRSALIEASWMNAGIEGGDELDSEIIESDDAAGNGRDTAKAQDTQKRKAIMQRATAAPRKAQQRLEVEQAREEPTKERGGERGEESPLAAEVGEQVQSRALAALLPGAGVAFDAYSKISEVVGGPAVAAAPARFVQQSESGAEQEQEEEREL